jgi:hypothetical protein
MKNLMLVGLFSFVLVPLIGVNYASAWNCMNLRTNSWFSTGIRAVVGKLLLGCLVTVLIAVLFPSHGFAKPKKPYVDENNECVMLTKCTFSGTNSTCAKLYCRALRAKCKGVYTSGKCKTIKDEHEDNFCSTAGNEDCGKKLPRILAIGDLRIDMDSDDVYVVTDPEDDNVDLSSVIDAAMESAVLLDPKTCIDRCQSKVSKECAAACLEICSPEQY